MYRGGFGLASDCISWLEIIHLILLCIIIHLVQVDGFLDKMADLTKEDDQRHELSKIICRCWL